LLDSLSPFYSPFFSFQNLEKSQHKPSSLWKYILNDVAQDKYRTIDIWVFSLEEWEFEESYQHLMFQLGYLLKESGEYKRYHKLRLMSIVDDEEAIADEEERMKNISKEARITAEIHSFSLGNRRSISDNRERTKTSSVKSSGKCFCGTKKEMENEKKYELINEIILRASENTSRIVYFTKKTRCSVFNLASTSKV
jgi:hypothetical protein